MLSMKAVVFRAQNCVASEEIPEWSPPPGELRGRTDALEIGDVPPRRGWQAALLSAYAIFDSTLPGLAAADFGSRTFRTPFANLTAI